MNFLWTAIISFNLMVLVERCAHSQTEPTTPWPPLSPGSVRLATYPTIKAEGCGQTVVGVQKRIHNGTPATVDDFPWAAALVEMLPPMAGETAWWPQFLCAANIISDYWLLTTFWCLHWTDKQGREWPIPTENLKFYAGTTYRMQTNHAYDVDYIVVHREFDISLVKVKTKIEPVVKDGKYLVNYVCLPESWNKNNGAEDAVYAGWGRFDSNIKSRESLDLRKAKITINPAEDCKRILQQTRISPNYWDYHVCAEVNKWIPCWGDRGDGLVQYVDGRAVLIGLLYAHFPDPFLCEPPGFIIFGRISMLTTWMDTEIGFRQVTVPPDTTTMIPMTTTSRPIAPPPVEPGVGTTVRPQVLQTPANTSSDESQNQNFGHLKTDINSLLISISLIALHFV